MKKIIPALLLLWVTNMYAQHSAIAFDSSLSSTLQKAKKENKLVFVDCQTSWCSPCRMMEKQIFTLDSVGQFLNEHFASASIDMEKGQGIENRKKYGVKAFPTFLILTAEGKELYRFTGFQPVDAYMKHVRTGMDPNSPVVKAIAAYKKGDRSGAILREYIKYNMAASEASVAKDVALQYFDKLSPQERIQPENWFLFDRSSGVNLFGFYGNQFNYLADHWRDFATYNGKDKVEMRLRSNYEAIINRMMRGSSFRVQDDYNKKEFDHYREQILLTELPDKEQIAAGMEIAQAAAEKNIDEVSELMIKYIPTFSPQRQSSMMFSYINMLDSDNNDFKKLPSFRGVVQTVVSKSKNDELIKQMEQYQ